MKITSTRTGVAKEVLLDAGPSTDPDGSWLNLMVRWDVNGDGNFDTDLTAVKSHKATYTEPGVYQVVAQLTDEYGDSSVSVPIGIRVERHVIPVDIKPGEQNSINPNARGGVWVAVLSDRDFDSARHRCFLRALRTW